MGIMAHAETFTSGRSLLLSWTAGKVSRGHQHPPTFTITCWFQRLMVGMIVNVDGQLSHAFPIVPHTAGVTAGDGDVAGRERVDPTLTATYRKESKIMWRLMGDRTVTRRS